MALATTLTPLTSRPDTLTNAYKVVFCVRAQGRITADGKSVLRCLLAQQADLGVFWGLCEEVETG